MSIFFDKFLICVSSLGGSATGWPGWGEFSPIWRLFSLDSYFENDKSKQTFTLLLVKEKVMYCILYTKNGLHCIFGDFFTNKSGHPDSAAAHAKKP
jgi:hypothetical protein